MDRRPTNEEWTDLLQPFLTRFYNRSARRRLCQLHRDSPVKECKIQQPWPTGETAFLTISSQGIKVWIVSRDGGSVFMEFDANGHQIQGIRQAPDGSII